MKWIHILLKPQRSKYQNMFEHTGCTYEPSGFFYLLF